MQERLFPVAPGPRARRGDPITSQWSAAREARFWESQAGKVLDEIDRAGPATSFEIALALGGVWDNVRVSRRTSDLKRLGLIRPAGNDGTYTRWEAT